MVKVKLYTISQAAEYAGVTRQTIYVWMNKGKRYRRRLHDLPGVYIRGHLLIRKDELDDFLDRIGYEPPEDE